MVQPLFLEADFSALSRNFSCFSRLAAVLCSTRSATAGQCNVVSWQCRVVLHPELPCSSSAQLSRRSETVILKGDAANMGTAESVCIAVFNLGDLLVNGAVG